MTRQHAPVSAAPWQTLHRQGLVFNEKHLSQIVTGAYIATTASNQPPRSHEPQLCTRRSQSTPTAPFELADISVESQQEATLPIQSTQTRMHALPKEDALPQTSISENDTG